MSQSKPFRGSIAIATCQTCQAALPFFEFEMESDTGTVGLSSAAKCNGLDVVIIETSADVWKAMQSGELSTLPARFGSFAGFHVLHIKRIEKSPEPPAEISFAEYRKIYRPPVVVYECPCCTHGEAFKTRELTILEFEKMGGKVIAFRDPVE